MCLKSRRIKEKKVPIYPILCYKNEIDENNNNKKNAFLKQKIHRLSN